jgi:undecaprenyl-diphosphatase
VIVVPPLEADVSAPLALLLGVLQGITEWLPVSSEGVVAATYATFRSGSFDDAVTLALWLHIGTSVSALVALRTEVKDVVKDLAIHWRSGPSPLTRQLLLATIVSGLVGLPMLLALQEVSVLFGASAMGLIGALMLVTGAVQLRRPGGGTRVSAELSTTDGLLAGIAQGLAVLPGLSRSGSTVAVLLARRIERQDALVFSFLMSIPASFGAALYAGVDSGLALSSGALVASIIACIVGLMTIRGLLVVAQRVNFGFFVLLIGALMLGSGVWQALT